MGSVLFVRTANICRSPMAENAGPDARSESAGVAVLVGEPVAPQAVRATDELGTDIGGNRGLQVDARMVGGADLVLAVTPEHREDSRVSHVAGSHDRAFAGSGPRRCSRVNP